ncbi:bone sialoprotein 2 [Eumetopias jubatus]|uniref:bone sialoprotein 2 n=1 Tax=Eumetopias jubatus TaxID=34886 RepID=UPI001016A87A|nr:bone sialoprotein 2 [Eumetopias jubatus]
MKTALILLSILGMTCAFSMKNTHRRAKLEDSEENGVFKYRPRYSLYKHAYFYPPLKRFPVQSSSDSSEEDGNGDSSEEEEEEENSNEEENNEENANSDENEDEESEAENTTLSTTPGYGEETTPATGYIGLAAMQLLKKAGDRGHEATKEEESDEEEEDEENEAEVDENGQGINGTSSNSTEAENGNGSSDGDNGEEGEEESVTEAHAEGTTVAGKQDSGGSKTTTSLDGGFEPTTPPPELYGTTTRPSGEATPTGYEGEYEQTGTNEYDSGYEVYENENGAPRGDNYRAYEDEYSYYKGHSYDGYDGQDYSDRRQ